MPILISGVIGAAATTAMSIFMTLSFLDAIVIYYGTAAVSLAIAGFIFYLQNKTKW